MAWRVEEAAGMLPDFLVAFARQMDDLQTAPVGALADKRHRPDDLHPVGGRLDPLVRFPEGRLVLGDPYLG